MRASRSSTLSRRRAALRRRPLIANLEGREAAYSTFAVSNSADSGGGSLRQAIVNSDNTAATPTNPHIITFNGLVNVAHIQLQSALPAITQPVIIDGTTEGSYNGAHPFVQLIGNYAGGSALGLDITASGTQVKALAIDGFNAGGVLIDNASNVVLDHDYVGIDTANNATGIDANGNVIYEGNGVYGVTIQSENGGTATGDVLSSDIVSANSYNGIILSGTGTTRNVVSATIIGSDNTGAAVVDDPGNALGNGQRGGGGSGVVINGGASYNTIGGTTAAARDVILGNKSYGVYITDGNSVHNVVEGDVIGTDITGLHSVDGAGRSYGNGASGVAIDFGASYNVVSGTATAPEVISANAGDGVLIAGQATYNQVSGVFIGTDINGENALPNADDGVAVTSASIGNFIGLSGGRSNVISGNAGNGVSLTGFDTAENFVENNLIGIDAGGTTSLGNGQDGVLVNGQASTNFIGYAASGDNNVISGNRTWGVYITDAGTNGNTVANNFIGTNVTGTYPVPNTDNGVDIVFGAQNNTLGGTTAAARNVISGNLHEGVLIGFAGTSNNVVEGNFIGTDVTGKNLLTSDQQLDGVYVGLGAGSNTIGGQNPVGAFNTAAWNVISGNAVNGILVTDSGTTGPVISGNFIGTDVTGTLPLPNGGNGITIAAGTSGTTVGAETSGIGNLNVISGNLGDGISITSSSGNNVSFDYIGVDLNNQVSLPNRGNGVSIHAASGNRVNQDVIRNNGGYGILTDAAATANAWYYDSIYNNVAGGIAQPTNATPQPAPVLTAATVTNGQTTITGSVTGSPFHNTTLTIQLYASPAANSPAAVQGLTYIGSVVATTNASGNASFTTTLLKAVMPGQIITATADWNVASTSNFSNAETVVEIASATFVSTDTTTQGTWRNAYGADGYDIAADTSAGNPKLPSYATLGITGASTYTWAASTNDVRALQNCANTSRIAATWYSSTSMSFNLNLNDGQSHEVSLYAVDWDNRSRSEEVQIIDPTTGTVLDTEAIGHFQGGAYLTWNLSGNVVIKVANLGGANAVISGLFFGGKPTTSATAQFVGTNTTAQGSWRGVVGADGYDIEGDTSAGNPKIPSYATLGITGASTYTWAASTTDVRGLQNSAGTGRIAATWYSSTSMSFNLNLTDGQVHEVSLYAVDWDNRSRSEEVQIIDPTTGNVLDTETLGSFQSGEYLSWKLSGNVVIKVTNLNPAQNAVVSGLFFGGMPTITATAHFLGTNTTTQGSWHGVLGADGYDIEADTSAGNPKIPSYAALGITGASNLHVGCESTTDVQELCRTPLTPAESPPPGTPALR